MEEKGVTPADIKSSDDLYKLPFLTKSDLWDAYPYGLVGMPLKDCVRIQSTSGTTGKRVVAFYTQEDIDLWEDCCARLSWLRGAPMRMCARCPTAGLFTGGPGLNGGSHKVGCLTIPHLLGQHRASDHVHQRLERHHPVLHPSYAANRRDHEGDGNESGGDPPEGGAYSVRKPGPRRCARTFRIPLGIKAYDIYGLTELSGPGVSFECSAQRGMHINEDHFIAEIIDPDTGEVLPEGSEGELVFTSITKKAFPLLRYRTRDICTLTREKCPAAAPM